MPEVDSGSSVDTSHRSSGMLQQSEVHVGKRIVLAAVVEKDVLAMVVGSWMVSTQYEQMKREFAVEDLPDCTRRRLSGSYGHLVRTAHAQSRGCYLL